MHQVHPSQAHSTLSCTSSCYVQLPEIYIEPKDEKTMVLHFPLTDEVDDNWAVLNAAGTFEDACRHAAEEGIPLVLTEDVILSETITLRNQQCLRMDATKRVRISGELHSLFLLNNKSQLILRNIDLDHTLSTDDHKQVGAAINIRSKGKVDVSFSRIVSTSGFCVWAVQKSHVCLQNCELAAKARSAMVCFGQVGCQLSDCLIPEAGVHGLCARGACQIHLRRCDITGSAARAIYAYANASVHLELCHIQGTLHPDKAAIEVSSMGCGETTSSALMLRDCHVTHNRGAGVRLRGNVSYRVDGQNVLESNDKGDWDILDESDVVQPEAISDSSSPALQRDEAGSSFRQGDWWCLSCQTINAARRNHQDVCNQCGVERFKCGRLLTMDEIRQCNQGIDIRKSSLLLLDEPRTKFDEELNSIVLQDCRVVWEFDSDDARGWLPYDHQSSQLLEEMYIHCQKTSLVVSSSNDDEFCISLCGHKYLVNVVTMQQTNNETHFLRKVRRRIIR